MAWTASLRSDIADTFDLLEGCMEPGSAHAVYGLTVVAQTNIGSGDVIHGSRAGGSKRAYDRARAALPSNAEASKVRNKTRKLKASIMKWQTEAKLIMVGRDLPPEMWMEILRNPVSETELAAFTDFCFFQKHRHVSVPRIASSLETNESEVRAALASRGVT